MSRPEAHLPPLSGPLLSDPAWPSPWVSNQASGPLCCGGFLKHRTESISELSSRTPASTVSICQPTTFCALRFGSHLGAATAPRHGADRYWCSCGGTKHTAVLNPQFWWFCSVIYEKPFSR
jgi:hypothetical protein